MTVEIHSEDGFVAIFGSANTIDFFTHTAEVKGLTNTILFFKHGVTAHPDLVAFELGKVEWPLTDELNEVADKETLHNKTDVGKFISIPVIDEEIVTNNPPTISEKDIQDYVLIHFRCLKIQTTTAGTVASESERIIRSCPR